MTDSERLTEVLKMCEMSANAFSAYIGLKRPQNLYDVLNGRNAISKDLATLITAKCVNVSAGWLLTGEGNMLSAVTPAVEVNTVPLLPVSAQAGSLNDFLVTVNGNGYERIVSPVKGADFALTVSGDSMFPEYPAGSYVFVKKVDEKVFIEWGGVYVLDTLNGSVIKKLMPVADDPGRVRCESINPAYPAFDIKLSDVFGVYKVLLCMSMK